MSSIFNSRNSTVFSAPLLWMIKGNESVGGRCQREFDMCWTLHAISL